MMNIFKLGIITPIMHTPKQYFIECINSVKQLSNKLQIPVQWIIVADGDNRAIEQWLKENVGNGKTTYKLLKFKENIGLGAARNIAVETTDAEYITWLDADDLFNTDEAVSFFLSGIGLLTYREDIALVYSDNVETDQSLKPRHIRQKSFFHKLHLKYRSRKVDPIYYVDFIYQAQILRKSDFIKIGGFDERNIGEDVELLLRIATHYPWKIFYHLPYFAYIYRHNPTGIVSTRYQELRQLNCKAYLTYARKAKIHQSEHVSFEVLFFDDRKDVLNNEPRNYVFFNTFLPDDSNDLFYIQRSNSV